MGDARCIECDRQFADRAAMDAVCGGGLECRCLELFPGQCISPAGDDCERHAVDWRARALAAEAAYLEARTFHMAQVAAWERDAVAEERALAVAYLRGRKLLNDADRIEAGEHLAGEVEP